MSKYKDKKSQRAPKVVVKTCYDGDQFGEMTYFSNLMHKSGTSAKE